MQSICFANYTVYLWDLWMWFLILMHYIIATLLKKRLAHVFSCGFCKKIKEHFFLQNISSGCFWSIFLITPKKYFLYVNTNFMETNHEVKTNIFSCLWYWCWKNLYFLVKLNSLGINKIISFMNTSPKAVQMFFKIGALKNFAILMLTYW